MNDLAVHGDRRMTVKEVAEVLGVHYDTVASRVKQMFPELVKNGITTYLDEAHVTTIKLDIQNSQPANLRNAPKVQNAKTDMEKALLIRQAMQFQQEIIDTLQAKVEEDRPKVEFFNQVADSADALQMRDVAAILNIPEWGRNTIFEFLRKQGVLDSRNIPYREYQDQGYFRVIEQKYSRPDGETCINLKTLVYQTGVEFIRRLVKEAA